MTSNWGNRDDTIEIFDALAKNSQMHKSRCLYLDAIGKIDILLVEIVCKNKLSIEQIPYARMDISRRISKFLNFVTYATYSKIALKSNFANAAPINGQKKQDFDKQKIICRLPLQVKMKDLGNVSAIIAKEAIVCPHQYASYLVLRDRYTTLASDI